MKPPLASDESASSGAPRQPEPRAASESQRLLERLADLAQTLGTARELVTIFRALRDFAIDEMPVSGIFISLYDPERSVRTAVYAWSEGKEADLADLPAMPMTDSPHSRAVATGQVIITDDFQATIAGLPKVDLGFEIDPRLPRSSLAAPMAVMGRIVGAVEVQSWELAAFGQRHATRLRMAANLAGIAVENVRLLERERGARAAAEEASRLKDEFLAMVSHELRTPLTSIFGWTRLLRTEELDAGTLARALETIERNARSQARLIDDLLEVSSMIRGNLRLEARPVELAQVIEAAIHSLRPAADAKAIRIDYTFEPGIGLISGDPDRLQQVVWNVLSNAIKFTSPRGRVEVRVRRVDRSAEIRVSDTGQGISPAFLPYVFDRFRQADSTITRLHGGLGLGLSIVRELVELHGGTVHAESRGEGRGATFTIHLPISTDRTEVGQPARSHQAPGTATSPDDPAQLNGLQVLVVEDEPDTRELLTLVLAERGARVTVARSADEALAALERFTPDVLLSDIGMPAENGYALIGKVRALGPDRGAIPAVALTAHAGIEHRVRALAAGYQMHVRKPVEPGELVAVVAGLVGRSRKHHTRGDRRSFSEIGPA